MNVGGTRSSVSACASPIRAGSPSPSMAGSTGSLPTAVLRSAQRDPNSQQQQQSPFAPFPTGRRGLVERSTLIRHTTSHLHPQKGKAEIKMLQKFASQASNLTSAENQAFINEVNKIAFIFSRFLSIHYFTYFTYCLNNFLL